MSARYDVICIGGGTAGMTAARAAKARGKRVAIAEREAPRLGGDCTFWGCVPSKTLIEATRIPVRARALGLEPPPLDFAAVMSQVRKVVDGIAAEESAEVFERDGIDVVPGVHGLDSLDADAVVLATGTEPVRVDVGDIPTVTNETVFELTELPRRLAVVGGAATGLELAQAFARLGSQVTVYEKRDRILGSEEPEAGETVLASLRADGIDVRLGAAAEGIDADLVLLAAGRRPSLDEIDGLELGPGGYVKTDARMRTSRKGVYAAGDITGGVQYTHSAAQEGMVAGTNAAGGRAKVSDRVIPRVTFTDPEVASVGMTEAQAREKHGGAVEVAVLPLSAIDRAKILGRTEGFIKLVVHRRGPLGGPTGGRLLGAHVVGEGAGELIHEAVLVMQSRAFAGRLAQAIHAYPTMSVGMQQAAALLFPQGRAQVPGAGD